MHVMKVSPLTANETAAETLARLRADSDVEYAVPDRRVYPHAVSNDPLAGGQWYLAAAQSTPSAINAQGAWDLTTGSRGVVVAVVDTGVLFNHPDLGRASAGGKFLSGYDFVSPDSTGVFKTANDGDGRDADATDPGDWVTAADNCNGGDVEDSSWHGTRVSGIIGALTNNGAGVAGVMWNGSILPVRVLGKCGGYNSDVMEGIRWAAGLSVPGVPANTTPAQIINVSLGSTGTCDTYSQDTISQVSGMGVLVVVSAGNEGGPVDTPANCAGAMAILGLRHVGTKVGFSSLGPEIALGAPGGNCVNTTGGPCLYSIDTTSNLGTTTAGLFSYTNQTNYNVGTSFSSPIVSGIAGLMLAVNGNLKAAQLIRRMQLGATPYPTTSSDTGITTVCHVPANASDIQDTECICTTSVCGAGMANALGAVNEALRPIAAIAAPATYPASSTVTLQAGGSAGACGRNIASYAWSVLSGPGALTSTNTATTSITAPASGATVVQLVVTDDTGKLDTATITLYAATSSTIAPSSAGTQACLTPDNTVTVTASDASASETGPDPGVFTLTRTGVTTAALTVNLAFTGTAINGTDYATLGSSVVIPAGQTSVTVTVTPLDDTVAEQPETVILTLQPGNGYAIGAASSATVTITDNDVAPATHKGGGALDPAGLSGLLALTLYALRRRVTLRAVRP